MQIASVLVFADIKFGGRRMGVFCVTLIDEPGLGGLDGSWLSRALRYLVVRTSEDLDLH